MPPQQSCLLCLGPRHKSLLEEESFWKEFDILDNPTYARDDSRGVDKHVPLALQDLVRVGLVRLVVAVATLVHELCPWDSEGDVWLCAGCRYLKPAARTVSSELVDLVVKQLTGSTPAKIVLIRMILIQTLVLQSWEFIQLQIGLSWNTDILWVAAAIHFVGILRGTDAVHPMTGLHKVFPNCPAVVPWGPSSTVSARGGLLVELQTKFLTHNRRKGPNWDLLLVESNTGFTYKNLLKQYPKQVWPNSELTWNWVADAKVTRDGLG